LAKREFLKEVLREFSAPHLTFSNPLHPEPRVVTGYHLSAFSVRRS